jgi:hypothetical protein
LIFGDARNQVHSSTLVAAKILVWVEVTAGIAKASMTRSP